MCYAYEPSVKPGEVLSNKFRAHKWWLPSAGELGRICYYKLQGYDYGNKQAIFAKAYNIGIFTPPNDKLWSSTEHSEPYSWFVRFSDGYVGGGGYFKYSNYPIRAVAAF